LKLPYWFAAAKEHAAALVEAGETVLRDVDDPRGRPGGRRVLVT
jgi:hypothetical protein